MFSFFRKLMPAKPVPVVGHVQRTHESPPTRGGEERREPQGVQQEVAHVADKLAEVKRSQDNLRGTLEKLVAEHRFSDATVLAHKNPHVVTSWIMGAAISHGGVEGENFYREMMDVAPNAVSPDHITVATTSKMRELALDLTQTIEGEQSLVDALLTSQRGGEMERAAEIIRANPELANQHLMDSCSRLGPEGRWQVKKLLGDVYPEITGLDSSVSAAERQPSASDLVLAGEFEKALETLHGDKTQATAWLLEAARKGGLEGSREFCQEVEELQAEMSVKTLGQELDDIEQERDLEPHVEQEGMER